MLDELVTLIKMAYKVVSLDVWFCSGYAIPFTFEVFKVLVNFCRGLLKQPNSLLK